MEIFSYHVVTIDHLLATENVRLSASARSVYCDVNGRNRIQTDFTQSTLLAALTFLQTSFYTALVIHLPVHLLLLWGHLFF